jgi:hypothetical protein
MDQIEEKLVQYSEKRKVTQESNHALPFDHSFLFPYIRNRAFFLDPRKNSFIHCQSPWQSELLFLTNVLEINSTEKETIGASTLNCAVFSSISQRWVLGFHHRMNYKTAEDFYNAFNELFH